MTNAANAMTRQGLKALAHQILGPDVGVGAEKIGHRTARALKLPELAQTGGMVPDRVAEFVAGRLAAREAMGRDDAIIMGDDRAPLWPTGISGSISHAHGWAVAAATAAPLMVGLDLDTDTPLPDEIWDTVLLPSERDSCLAAADPGQMAKVIFSIKEAAYKAQYPITRQLFGFDRFSVDLDGGSFSARFTAETGPFAAGTRLLGRFRHSQGFVLSGIAMQIPNR